LREIGRTRTIDTLLRRTATEDQTMPLLAACCALLLSSFALTPRAAEPAPALPTARWQEDLTFLVKTLEASHPDPYTHISRQRFHRAVAALRRDIPALSRPQIVVRMMQLVASIQDGHTTLNPFDPNGFNVWFPVRFYWFRDGIFITATDEAHKALVGARVLTIGRLPAEEAARRASSLQGADNTFARQEHLAYLANATALYALHILPTPDSLPLTVQISDGRPHTLCLRARRTTFTEDNWIYWGEMYGPPGIRFLATRHLLASSEFRKGLPFLPLHLRDRYCFWFTYLEEKKTLYMQFNFVQNAREETFRAFHNRLFQWVDQHPVDTFILDIRYNSGGDGSLLIPFVHQFIKRDAINRPGHLYTLIGRKTFSAGVMLIDLMQTHTNTLFVGEPAGAPLNSYGDPETYLLPNSRLELQVSRLYHQLSASNDKSRYFAPQIPAVFGSEDYFADRDPALEILLNTAPRALPDLFWEQGGEVALAEYQKRLQAYGGYAWWRPFTETSMNTMGYQLLEAGRTQDALTAFRLNADQFPLSWNVWDSLAEACLKNGDLLHARAYYARSLHLNPGNANARRALEGLKTGKGAL
jgi:hypothetical protein